MTPRRQQRAVAPAVAALVAVLVAGLVGGVAVLGGLGREQALSGGVVREALVVDGPMTLVPPFAETPNSRDVSGLLYRGLTRTGPDARPVGELARDWNVDAGARTFTFHLRKGLRWSDGAPITSADALYTLSILQSDADARSSTGQAWSGISATAPLRATNAVVSRSRCCRRSRGCRRWRRRRRRATRRAVPDLPPPSGDTVPSAA